jgi:Na+/proline symporter
VASAVLATIDSAILSPASVLAENVLAKHRRWGRRRLLLDRVAVVVVGACALVMALLGQDAYSLIEDAYALGLVALLVPLLGGLWWPHGTERSALAAMFAGTGTWVMHQVLGWESFLEPWALAAGVHLPTALTCTVAAAAAYRFVR